MLAAAARGAPPPVLVATDRPALRQRQIGMRPTEHQRHSKQLHLVHQAQPALKLKTRHPPTLLLAAYTSSPPLTPPPATMHLMLNSLQLRRRLSRSLAVRRAQTMERAASSGVEVRRLVASRVRLREARMAKLARSSRRRRGSK